MKQSPAIYAERKLVVLLADDDDMCLEVCARMLQRLGIDVLQARDGREAVDIYRNNKDVIDLVILDMQMPHNGAMAFEKIRALHVEVKIIVASGYVEEDLIGELLAKGCRGFIQKPFGIEKLAREIQKTIA